MSYLLLILLLLIGCEEDTPVEPQNVNGCLDSQACNYNATATIDNNSCWYVSEDCSCEDEEDSEIDMCGVCDADETNNCIQDECGIWGGEGVDVDDDGECDDIDECIGQYDECNVCNGDNSSCSGCTDIVAENYDPDATKEYSHESLSIVASGS
jgi:hypothetical protein